MAITLNYNTPRVRQTLPAALIAVAWIFIAFGILAALEMASALLHGQLNLNFAACGLLIGPGLLKRHAGWRMWAIGLLCVNILGIGVVLAFVLADLGRARVSGPLLAIPLVRQFPHLIAVATCVGILALEIWRCHVLMRRDVRALFARKPLRPAAVADYARQLERIEEDEETR